MQVDPINPTLKPPGTKRLKLKCEKLLSTFAFKFNLRRYNKAMASIFSGLVQCGAWGRGLHSFALELNLSDSRT